MSKVYLYEDTSGSLYLHQEGDDTVYAHLELVVPYNGLFERDASELDSGVKPDETVERIPFSQFEEQVGAPTVRRIAVWEDGRMKVLGSHGADAGLYLRSPYDVNPAREPGDGGYQ